MIIDCIADLHGEYPELKGGDMLIIAGDLTASHTIRELDYFNDWIREQPYDKKILIGGNHDTFFEQGVFSVDDDRDGVAFVDPCVDYLFDSGLEYMGLKIWGSPWTHRFLGINPNCTAFTYYDEVWYDENILSKIPADLDILITHGPPYGILDKSRREQIHTGSGGLRRHVMDRIKPRYHVFGHIHEWGGKLVDCVTTRFINASLMNEDYEAVNKPVRITI